MKKYIWAKDTPLEKKGDEFNVEISKNSGLLLGVYRGLVTFNNIETLENLIEQGWIEEVNERWKPKELEHYWGIGERGDVFDGVWSDSWMSDATYKFGNCFQTKEEAETAAEKVKTLLLSLHE